MTTNMSLLDLHATVLLLGSHMSPNRRDCALRALRRIGRSGPALAQATVEDLPAVLAASHGPGFDRYRAAEEGAAIAEALALPTPPSDLLGAVRSGSATLAAALLAVEMQAWHPAERARVQGAIANFARRAAPAGGAAAIPATEGSINRLLGTLSHTDFGIAARSFANLQSRVRKAVRLVDLHAAIRVQVSDLTPAWREVIEALSARSPRQHLKLWPLVSFCWWRGIEPCRVSDSILDELEADLTRRGRAQPHELVRAVVYVWEQVADRCGLPPLRRRYRSGVNGWRLGFDDLPKAFRASWERYAASVLRQPAPAVDPLALFADDEDDEFGDILARRLPKAESRLSPEALANFRTAVTYAAYADPDPSRLTELRDVLTPEHAVGALKAAMARQRSRRPDGQVERKSTRRLAIAAALVRIARDLRVDADVIKTLRQLQLKVDPRVETFSEREDGTLEIKWDGGRERMGRRHRERLRAFQDPAKLHAWLQAPDLLWERAERDVRAKRQPSAAACNDAIVALLHEILRSSPIRRRNLAEIRIAGPDANLRLTADRSEATLYLAPSEVKNRQGLPVPFTPRATKRLVFYLDHIRDVVAARVGADPDNPYLFPAAGHGHRAKEQLNQLFVGRNRKLGFVLNLHLSRHLAAKLLIDTKGRAALALIQAILGHRSRETTEAYYAEINTLLDHKTFQALLLQAAERLSHSSRKRRAS